MNVSVGLGSASALLNVHIANRPPLERYENLREFTALGPGEIAGIAKETGNHWRKIFNVYAKLVYGLDNKIQSAQCQKKAPASFDFGALQHDSWQSYRDSLLLQLGSDTALWFNRDYDINQGFVNEKSVHIVMGRQYAASLNLPAMMAFNADFSINMEQRVIISPYFDYRQLSNKKLDVLVEILAGCF